MAGDSLSSGVGEPLINVGAFMRTLLWPLITWGGMVLLVTMGGQPGVVCVTPMAWLLALWSGGRYASWTSDLSKGRVLLGAALAGVTLGVCLGVVFALGATRMAPDPANTDEVARAIGLTHLFSLPA